jgi:hypothetical protein
VKIEEPKTHTVGVSTETDPWVSVPKQELNLQEVKELDEESKEIVNMEPKQEPEENIELNLEEKNIEEKSIEQEVEEEREINNTYATNELLKVRDEFLDSINNSALMEVEKQREGNLLSEAENEDEEESENKKNKPLLFEAGEEEDIKEHK